MASFRVLDRLQVYYNLNGTAPAAGGRIDFFESGTTTPKEVFADPDLNTSNGSTVGLDAAGRPSDDTWGEGSYRVRQYDADDTLIGEMDDVEIPGGSGTSIPALEADSFLTNDGAQLLWDEIRQLPDPTGQAGKFLQTDGTGFTYAAITIPTPATPDIVLTGTGASGSYRFGTSAVAKKGLIMFGSHTVTASGQTAAAQSFDFVSGGAAQFDEAPRVFIVGKSASVAAEGQIPAVAVTSTTTGGFSVALNTDDYTRNGSRINSNVPFDWIAFGFKTV